MRHRLLLICLVLSGFAGLAYELLWTRLLSFSFGSTTLSFSTVLAVFFGGLAFGAYLAGRRSASLIRPVRAYALIELGTGVLGLLVHPLLRNLGDVFTRIDPGPGLAGALVRFAVSAPILLLPTLLMGATLPIICRAMIAEDDEVGHGTALIYGVNTFGACLGAYAVTYHLLPSLGVTGSNLVAVLANFAAGGAALMVARNAEGSMARPRPAPRGAAETPDDLRLVIIASALTGLCGFAAIALQIVWIRLFSTFLLGTIYGVGAVLISVLIGIAIGSVFIARELRRARHPVLWLVGLQIATVFAVAAFAHEATWIAFQFQMLGRSTSQGLSSLHTQLVATFAVLAVPTIASGASFPLLVHLIERRAENTGRRVGSLYAANTVGSILGSLIGGFVILPQAGSQAAMFIALVTSAMVAAIAVVMLPSAIPRLGRLLLAATAVASPLAYDGFDVQKLALSFPPGVTTAEQYESTQTTRLKQVAYFAEGEHTTVVVSAGENTRSLALSGLGQGTRFAMPPHHLIESLLVGLVPLAHASALDRALVVGLGAGQTVELLSDLGVKHVKVVELEARVIDAVRVIFEPEVLIKPDRVEAVVNDARHELLVEKNRGGGRYDLITSMPAHPWVAASIFTREFFELARDNLAEDGLFCTWFGAWRMDDVAVKSLLRAFTQVFASYAVYWAEEAGAYYLVGSMKPLHIDLDRLAQLLREPLLAEQPSLNSLYYLPSRLYASGTIDTPKPAPGIVNTDDSAFVETHAPRSSTRSPVLEEFMPVEYVHPSLIAPLQRESFYVGLLEELLGTPEGRIPHESVTLRASRAKKTFAGVREIFTPEIQRYFEGRLALVDGHGDRARMILEEVAKLGGPLAHRAAKFAALARPRNSLEQIDALASLSPETDVALRILAVDPARGLERAPPAPDDPKRDPIAWLLATARAGDIRDPASARILLRSEVGPMLKRTSNPSLLKICEIVAMKLALDREATSCHDDRRRLETAESKNIARAGMRAGAKGNFSEAAAILAQAESLAPADETVTTLLLRALVETSDESALTGLKQRLRFQGRSEAWIDYMFGQARARKLGQSAIEEATQAPPATSTEAFAPKE